MKVILNRLYQFVIELLIALSAILLSTKSSKIQQHLLSWRGIRVSGPVFFDRRVILTNPERLQLGHRVAIGIDSVIACHAEISIGDDFLAAPGLYINSGGHDKGTMESIVKPITIGNRVWCGVRVTICAGVDIGDDVVIGAGSVVVRSIPSGCVAVGIPAKIIGEVNRDVSSYQSWCQG